MKIWGGSEKAGSMESARRRSTTGNRSTVAWMSVKLPTGVRQMEDENRRLTALVAALSLDREALKGVIRKHG